MSCYVPWESIEATPAAAVAVVAVVLVYAAQGLSVLTGNLACWVQLHHCVAYLLLVQERLLGPADAQHQLHSADPSPCIADDMMKALML